jgi:outer membrane immunogenic protein
MKRVLFAAAAMAALATAMQSVEAAELPPREPQPPPLIVVWTWDGFYAGVNAGYSIGPSDTTARFVDGFGTLLSGSSTTVNLNGWIAGGQAGYNWVFGTWVWGVEFDFQGTGQEGNATFSCTSSSPPCTPVLLPSGRGSSVTFSQDIEWLTTLRLRFGTTVTPTILAYLTGGFAVGQVSVNANINSFDNGVPVAFPFSFGKAGFGWTIGAGSEWRISSNWTAKIEYLFVDLGSVSSSGICDFCGPPELIAALRSNVTDHILRVGVNYRLGVTERVISRY